MCPTIPGRKVQAIKIDPGRRAQDWDDIEKLAARHREALDWLLVEEYFDLFGMAEDFRNLRARIAPSP